MFFALTAAAVVSAAAPAPIGDDGAAIPYFARRYNAPCSQCHALPPKLNAYGEEFRQNGYRARGLEAGRTVPLAVWASGRADVPASGTSVRDELVTYLNRLELISGGQLLFSWLSYFVEWRALSRETRGGGGFRDRSGRFEDLFVLASTGPLSVTAGQFRLIDQVDVSLRQGVSEPLLLSASLPGEATADARRQGLRGFSPAGRSPAVRAAVRKSVGPEWTWTGSLAVPVPGEFSIPLTREARREASNEIEFDPKGVVLESYVRRGTTTWGGHGFYDNSDRYLANLIHTGAAGSFYWTAIAGVERSERVARGRWSVEAEAIPYRFAGFGLRVEDRAGDSVSRAFVPYAVAHGPGSRYTARLAIEQRFQRGRNATLVELGFVF